MNFCQNCNAFSKKANLIIRSNQKRQFLRKIWLLKNIFSRKTLPDQNLKRRANYKELEKSFYRHKLIIYFFLYLAKK